MKALVRMYMWWPGIDSDIESLVRICQQCQSSQPAPPPAPLHPWNWPGIPWSRLYMDFAGPFMGHNFLIVVDAHSKWIEVFQMSSTTSVADMERLCILFAQFGIPQTIVTDNRSAFVSQEFESFLQYNGIKHLTSSPYHPASNGLAERAVETFKTGLKQVIRVQKLVGLPPPALELLGVFLRFRIIFAEVITFSGASAHEF